MKIIHCMKEVCCFCSFITFILCHGKALQIYPVICFHILYCFPRCVYQRCRVVIHIPILRPGDVVDKSNATYSKMIFMPPESTKTSNDGSQKGGLTTRFDPPPNGLRELKLHRSSANGCTKRKIFLKIFFDIRFRS